MKAKVTIKELERFISRKSRFRKEEPLVDGIFNKRISECDLRNRTKRKLYKLGIISVNDLVEYGYVNLINIDGFGVSSLWDIDNFLESNGLIKKIKSYKL
jgi:DNA-directed RNA polymerase alpha subunit